MNKRRDINRMLIQFRQEMIDKCIVRNKSEFADKLASDTSTLSKIEKGNRAVSLDMIIRLFINFGEYITPNSLFGFEDPYGNITFFTDANAGTSISIESKNTSAKFKLPDLTGEYVAFRVKGDSMTPTLHNNDILICKELTDQQGIIDNKIYVIISNDGVNVKRIKITKKENLIEGLTLISDNSSVNPPKELDFSEGLYSSPFYKMYRPIKLISEFDLK